MNEKITYKNKAMKLFLLFLAAMGIMSLVSRGIYASHIPKVSTVSMVNRALSFKVECSGTLETSKEFPVFALPDLRISEICVRRGDKVEEGDVLIRFDSEYLEGCIKSLENELETDRLTRLDYGNAQAWNSIKILDISMNSKKEKLEKYKKLLENKSELTSKTIGVITDVRVGSGDITGETAVLLIADASADLHFSADISKEDAERISVGDLVNLKFRNGKVNMNNCEISAINAVDNEDFIRLEINMEPSELTIGEIGIMAITVLSEQKYDCIPIEAVHTSNDSMKSYVYVLEESEGFLGTEYHAVKKDIEIADKNESYAAVENSGINCNDKIVSFSNKEIFDGDIVRINF